MTQLFTEPYMVAFLLDNALGAWWAARSLSDDDLLNADSEEELRQKAAIPGVPLEYLRFIQEEGDDGKTRWAPAAGTFSCWPQRLSELKCLDPCCGSGHFLVSLLLMLTPLRMEIEGLDSQTAVDAVLRDNLHGLELDPRCVELAAFNLALSSWQYPDAGGFRRLPELNLACSGVPINSKLEDWLSLSQNDVSLEHALEELYFLFKNASTLGSLIDPKSTLSKKSMFDLEWDEIGTLVFSALANENDYDSEELSVTAHGAAKAASLLATQYQWIVTNVPYLGMKRMSKELYEYCEENFDISKADLATVFLDRFTECLESGSSFSAVMPQNWLFLGSYKKLREKLLQNRTLNYSVLLGAGAFEAVSGEVVKAALVSINTNKPDDNSRVFGLDLSDVVGVSNKASQLSRLDLSVSAQSEISSMPDSRVYIGKLTTGVLLEKSAISMRGVVNGDNERWLKKHWEILIYRCDDGWKPIQSSVARPVHFGGRDSYIDWRQNGIGMLRPGLDNPTYGKKGVALSRMGSLPATLYSGEIYDQNTAAIVPNDPGSLAALTCFAEDESFNVEVRKIDKKIGVTPATFLKIPFSLDAWQKEAANKYPNGLPRPYSDDPTLWIFHGHPCGSVIWDETAKWTAHGVLRTDNTVLHIIVARLLGYRWPAELDADMELASEQRDWVKRCEALLPLADDDGIVCIPAVRGEQPADQRLEAMLQTAYGDDWSIIIRGKLLEAVACKNKSLDFWLREKFFEQHCKLFQSRPFIWHVWDGVKDGFSALVNYHQLDRKNLERLIYTYLDDWIRTQKHGKAEGVEGAASRLAAAESLKQLLEQILEGEAPYDIFVRWKPLEEQPIGWNPDMNDGVRLNIRPFMSVGDVGKKGAGVLRAKPNIHWKKDRGKDVPSAPWYHLGPEYGEGEGARINDHHLSLAEKLASQES